MVFLLQYRTTYPGIPVPEMANWSEARRWKIFYVSFQFNRNAIEQLLVILVGYRDAITCFLSLKFDIELVKADTKLGFDFLSFLFFF
jgi:hypothetical protein